MDVGLRWSVCAGDSEEQRDSAITRLTASLEEAVLSINCSQPVESPKCWYCTCLPNSKMGSTSPGLWLLQISPSSQNYTPSDQKPCFNLYLQVLIVHKLISKK